MFFIETLFGQCIKNKNKATLILHLAELKQCPKIVKIILKNCQKITRKNENKMSKRLSKNISKKMARKVPKKLSELSQVQQTKVVHVI